MDSTVQHTLIIAEAGVNHNGNLDMARRLIDAAAKAGADYVKFQTFNVDSLVTRSARMADYQVNNTGVTESQRDMLKRLQLSPADHLALMEHCEKAGIRFLSTAFDLESVRFLHSLSPDVWKIPSGELTNYPYLKLIASYGQPVIMSTGMATTDEIRQAVDVLLRAGLKHDDITLLHCTTEYPCPPAEVNLRAMERLRGLGCRAGYSDHTQGIYTPVAAVALGACVIEKHFTLSRELPGPDHKASLEPHELTEMVKAIRNTELILGNGIKEPTPSELKNRDVARKSIVASRHIAEGELFSESNLTTKRPGTGISPMCWPDVIGKPAPADFEPDMPIYL